jgi:uncharacterized protein YrrD
MAESKDVVPIGSVVGMPIISLSTGNKLGQVSHVRIDPIDGRLSGLAVKEGENAELSYDRIYSFGRDAVMAVSDDSVTNYATVPDLTVRRADDLIGAKVVLESGEMLGEIADVLVALNPPPAVFYEIRRSMLDRLLGRTFFIPASVGYALSDDASRLIVPDRTIEIASADLSRLLGPSVDVKSFTTGPVSSRDEEFEEETVLRDEDATVLRYIDDDETLLVREDEDETIVRRQATQD